MENISTFQNSLLGKLVENISGTTGTLLQEWRQTKEGHESQKQASKLQEKIECVLRFQKNLEEGAGEIRGATETLLFRNSSHGDLLNEILATLHEFAEVQTVGKEGSTGMCDCSAQTAANIDELKETVTKANQLCTEGLGVILQNVTGARKTHTFFVTDVSHIMDRLYEETKAPCMSEKVYVLGYLISYGLYGVSNGTMWLQLWCRIAVHKGIMDDFLQWPFKLAFKISIIHPTSPDQRQERCVEDCSIEMPQSENGNNQSFFLTQLPSQRSHP